VVFRLRRSADLALSVRSVDQYIQITIRGIGGHRMTEVKEVRLLKAKALRNIAATIVSSTERSYLSSNAKLLDGTFRHGRL
jgi:hypothetical protein